MSILRSLTPEQQTLLRDAGVDVLLPHGADPDRATASAQTTVRAGRPRLVAFNVRIEDAESRAPRAVEVQTLVREALLASIPPLERGDRHDAAFIQEYLEREARSALTMRTLALPEGAASRLTTPLDQLISTRRQALPQARPAEMLVDGRRSPHARRIAFGEHAATWADLPVQRIACIVYDAADGQLAELAIWHP
jgi:hypothetical protein